MSFSHKPPKYTLYKIGWVLPTFPIFVSPALAPSTPPLLLSGSALYYFLLSMVRDGKGLQLTMATEIIDNMQKI